MVKGDASLLEINLIGNAGGYSDNHGWNGKTWEKRRQWEAFLKPTSPCA
jgi:hypothetical protein